MARFAHGASPGRVTRFAAKRQVDGDCSSRNDYSSDERSASPDSVIIIGTDNNAPRSNAMPLKNLRDRGGRKRQRSSSPLKVDGANKRRSHGHTPVKSENHDIGNQLRGLPETGNITQEDRTQPRHLPAPASLTSISSNAGLTNNNANITGRNANNNIKPGGRASSRFSTNISSPPKVLGRSAIIRGNTGQPGINMDVQSGRQRQHEPETAQDYNKHGNARKEHAVSALLYSRPDQRAVATQPVGRAKHATHKRGNLADSLVQRLNEAETNRSRTSSANKSSERSGRTNDHHHSRLQQQQQQAAPVSIKGRGAFRYRNEDAIEYKVSANTDRLSETGDYDSAVGIPVDIEDLKEVNRRLVNEVHGLHQKVQTAQTDASNADHAAKEAGIEARAAERAASEAKMDALDAKTKLSIVEARLENRIVELERVIGRSRGQSQTNSQLRNNADWGSAMAFPSQPQPYGRSNQRYIRRQ